MKIQTKDILCRMRATREQQQITQSEVARAVGFKSHVAYNLIENGERAFTLEVFLKIAAALNVSPYWLLGLDVEGLSADEVEFVELIRQLPDDLSRQYIKDHLRSFLRMMKK